MKRVRDTGYRYWSTTRQILITTRCVSPVVLANLQRPIIDGKKLELKRSKIVENLRYIIMADRIN